MNYCFTLAYNLPSEVEKVTKLLYEQNNPADFRHLIVDLGFPLETGDTIPSDYDKAKKENTRKLKELAARFGSDYEAMENIGVSQNWTQVAKFISPGLNDCLIGCDPDEHPQNRNWVPAVGKVLLREDMGLCSLMMTAHVPQLVNIPHSEGIVNGVRVYWFPDGSLNWALIGVSGRLLKAIGEIPYPKEAPRYGWIEGAMYEAMKEHRLGWCVLPDYQVKHTDYELGDEGTSILLRLWKNDIIYRLQEIGQPSFEQWMTMKREGKL